MTVSEESFKKIATLVGDATTPVLRKSTHAEKLKLYGLYKQATVGSERPARPKIFNIDGRMKWDAWAAEEKLSKDEARQGYADLAKELIGKPIEHVLASE
jgi:diazepam-binding inhibitor (GABA receptor modulating acyl-CoA-binding protein)